MRIMWTYYLAMAFLAFLIPDNILIDNAWAREFTDLMASIVPQIDRITALNIKPDVNRFYFSILWVGVPPSLFLYIWAFTNGRKYNYPIWTMPLSKAALYLFVLLVVMAYVFFNIPEIDDATNRLARTLLSNPIGRAVGGGATFVYAIPLCGAGVVVIVSGWLTGYIPRNIKAQKLKESEHG